MSSVVTKHFFHTYHDARANIINRATAARGWTHEQYPHPIKGPDGETLYTDTFRRGPDKASRVLVITSGTHGVEGFCGSALQSQFVAEHPDLHDDLAVLLVHAVNPFGFVFLRRVNEDNVDLNRNFINFSEELPKNEKYTELYDLINPVDMPETAIKHIMSQIASLQEELNFLTFMKALSGGQYEHPQGTHFGGQEATWSRNTMEDIWERELKYAQIVMQFDVHTGLGPSGQGMLMMAANPDEAHTSIIENWLGPVMITPRPATNDDVILSGYLNQGMETFLSDKWVIPITLEYGTKPVEEVLQVVIEDNWLCNHGAISSDRGRDIKKRLLGAFYPDDDRWREAVLARGETVFSKSLRCLSMLTPLQKETT